ncbi:MAG TPA: radical SAM protein [Terriglobales bacterium]|nr:radical SAM protein [Terriglobales bacterium]
MIATRDVWRAWGRILQGRKPALAIEITKECPLRCPGCYAYGAQHVEGERSLRDLTDFNGEELVSRALELAKQLRPLHISLVGGDPLVRYRELERLIPQLLAQGIFVQVVTSAFRPPPAAWAGLERFELVVSIDGLQPEHDARRKPATYERVRTNIRGQHVVVHCTITRPMLARRTDLEAFVVEWSQNPDVKKIWFSIFTPQRGAELAETPTPDERAWVIDELLRLRAIYPKLDMRRGLIEALRHPPASPRQCAFAQLTEIRTADLRTAITPCQFGGDPDCSRCGCLASMGLEAITRHRLPIGVRVGTLLEASRSAAALWARR